MRRAVLAALTILAAGPAVAADWRAMPVYGRDLGFVDADSVRRSPDGRIRFKARFLPADADPSGDLGYDAHDFDAAADCLAPDGEMKVAGTRRFQQRGKPATPEAWIVEEAEESSAGLARALCRGEIGYRRFARPEDAIAEYRDRHSVERLLAYVTPEAELTGTAVQGFEMNGISLCGSELGCTEGAPFEFCWLEGDIEVPVPAGARPEEIRRDTADYAFRGRIFRSPTGRGFGHVGASGCLAEATGPARPAAIVRPSAAEAARREPGSGEAAAAAHLALEEAVRGAGAVTAMQGGNSWTIDELKARPGGWQGACGSDLMFQGKSLEPYPTAIVWSGVGSVQRAGHWLEIKAGQWSGIQLHAGTAAEAEEYSRLLDELRKSGVVSAAQVGRRVTIRDGINTHHGPIFSHRRRLERASAADAIRLAGMVEALRNKEVWSVSSQGNEVTVLTTRTVRLTFESEAKARPVESAIQGLMAVCGAPPHG